MDIDEVELFNGNIKVSPVSGFTECNLSKIFSFSLFYPTSSRKNPLAWFNKYPKNQVDKIINNIVNHPNWSDFGVYIFLETSSLEKYEGIIESYRHYLQNYKERINLYTYSQVERKDVNKFSEYTGTIVRFFPMIKSDLWSHKLTMVLVRDAHTTMPNPKNSFDREWVDAWENSDKKLMIYHMPNYNPSHAAFRPSILAAAWGCRRLPGETEILYESIWNQIMDNFLVLNGYNMGYGIDERLLSLFMLENSKLAGKCYFIGVIYVLWLFVHKYNLTLFKNIITGGIEGSNLNYQQDIEAHKKLSHLDSRLHVENSDVIHRMPMDVVSGETYFQEVGCIVRYYNETIITKTGREPTVSDLFKYIEDEKIRNEDEFKTKLFNMVPSRWHLWTELFDGISDLTTITLGQYLQTTAQIYNKVSPQHRIDFRNQCNIISKYYRGDDFFFTKYQYQKIDDSGNWSESIPLPPDNNYLPINYKR